MRVAAWLRGGFLRPGLSPRAAILSMLLLNFAVNNLSLLLLSSSLAKKVVSLVSVVLIGLVFLPSWRFRARPVSRWSPGSPPTRGLVAFASLGAGVASAEAAIRHHRPRLEHVWLVDSDASRKGALELVSRLVEDEVVQTDQVHQIHLSDTDFDSPEAVRRLVEEHVYEHLPAGLAPEEVTIDLTGGKKTTTAGALLAGLPAGRRLQIVLPRTTDERGRATEAGAPAALEIDYRIERVRRAWGRGGG